jgi:uncharacterized protein YjbI with pentapeptide repeats
MAKKAAAAAPVVPLKLQGKSVYLAGNLWRSGERWKALVPAEGGTVADELTDKVDYMVLGYSAVANPQKKATKLNAQGAGIQVLTEEQFLQVVQPTSDEAETLLKGGEIERWNQLRGHKQRWGVAGRGSHVTVAHADLRGTNLAGADLALFEQCDFRDADLSRCLLQFAKCDLTGAKVKQAKILSFGECDASRVDFTDSELLNARFHHSILVGSRFAGMKLAAEFDDCRLDGADFSNVTANSRAFTSCSLVGADFAGSNLESSDFHDSDLSGAKFAGANLMMANFAGTKVDDADFTGATLVGAEIGGVDFSKAKGYDPALTQTKGTAGPAVTEFLKVVALQARHVNTTLSVTRGNDSTLLSLLVWPNGAECHDRAGTARHSSRAEPPAYIWSVLTTKWHDATPDLGSLVVRASKLTIAAKDLKLLALKAWCELFGIEAPSAEDLKKAAQASKAKKSETADEWIAVLKSGKTGVERWNADLRKHSRLLDKVVGIDLAGAKLAGVKLDRVEWKEADFRGADLSGTYLEKSRFPGGNFADADLTKARLSQVQLVDAKLAKANFAEAQLWGASLKGADCTGANFAKSELASANLCGADFTGASLADAKLVRASYDEHTRWPKKFSPTLEMLWKGPGTSPAAHALVKSTKPKGKLDIDQFMKRLEELTDAAKLSKALKMLKADRFRLYAQSADDHFVGVVKSQGDPDLVYSCRLNADGTYACCTQNLNICGGLRGSLCKHLLVLIVGLSKTGDLDPNAIDTWIRLSKTNKPALDKDAMSETFLRYKGAEAGEVDWRPTETIPEDYYAM